MREIYFKIKQNCELPVAMLNYTYKDFDGVIHPFSNIFVDFKEDLRNETRSFLNKCTDKEIQDIFVSPDVVKPLHIEDMMCKLVTEDRLNLNETPSWEIDEYDDLFESSKLDFYKNKHL